jgi:hypothetical protein
VKVDEEMRARWSQGMQNSKARKNNFSKEITEQKIRGRRKKTPRHLGGARLGNIIDHKEQG